MVNSSGQWHLKTSRGEAKKAKKNRAGAFACVLSRRDCSNNARSRCVFLSLSGSPSSSSYRPALSLTPFCSSCICRKFWWAAVDGCRFSASNAFLGNAAQQCRVNRAPSRTLAVIVPNQGPCPPFFMLIFQHQLLVSLLVSLLLLLPIPSHTPLVDPAIFPALVEWFRLIWSSNPL